MIMLVSCVAQLGLGWTQGRGCRRSPRPWPMGAGGIVGTASGTAARNKGRQIASASAWLQLNRRAPPASAIPLSGFALAALFT